LEAGAEAVNEEFLQAKMVIILHMHNGKEERNEPLSLQR
jgi:hypothetical protein